MILKLINDKISKKIIEGEKMNPKQECKKLINSFKYAIEGFISSFKTERNMKIHVLAMIIVIILKKLAFLRIL